MVDSPQKPTTPLFSTTIPPDLLRDESRRTGTAHAYAQPRNEAELAAALHHATTQSADITIQGSRTGIAGGAVPDGGVIIALDRMNRIHGYHTTPTGAPCLRVEPGVPLTTLRRYLRDNHPPGSCEHIFTPDPTETTASLGGMAACNASGACSYAYGAIRSHIHALRVMLVNGATLALQRNLHRARHNTFTFTTTCGTTISGTLPTYQMPATKNAAGYYIKPDMGLIDLFIGSEGTLGIITQLDLLLLPRPLRTMGVMAHLPNHHTTIQVVNTLRQRSHQAAPHQLTAIEYFDPAAHHLLYTAAVPNLRLPPPYPNRHHLLYTEWALATPHISDHTPETLLSEILLSSGAHPDHTWVATESPAMERLKAMRHAVPEQVNAIIAQRKQTYPQLTKLGTDLAVPDHHLAEILNLYRHDLARTNLQHVIFGHIGNNHLHVNILPRNPHDYHQGQTLIQNWATHAIALGGTISAEHGVGRLKHHLLAQQYGPTTITAMRQLKQLFDPHHHLNPNRIFPTR